jgi:hypothetical protein
VIFSVVGQIVTFYIIGQNVVWTKRGLDKSLLFPLLDKTLIGQKMGAPRIHVNYPIHYSQFTLSAATYQLVEYKENGQLVEKWVGRKEKNKAN